MIIIYNDIVKELEFSTAQMTYFQKTLIIHEEETKEKHNIGFMTVFICDKDTIAVLGKFLAGFCVSLKANFQNYKMIRFSSCSKNSHVFYRI